MATSFSEYDIADPPGLRCFTRAGWTVLSVASAGRDESASDAKIGQLTVPQRFELSVNASDGDGDWDAILMFLASDASKEIALASLLSTSLDVDVALDKLRAIRPIAWWKTKALLDLRLDVTLEAADIIERVYKNKDGYRDDDAASATSRWIFDQLQRVKDVPVTRRHDRVTDARLREVAKVYRDAWTDGLDPTKEVARQFYKSHSTAARYVMMARKAGHLGPANSSRGGELKS